ncbi:MAG: MarR family transcriptional regulator [Pirellulales bacterium]
MNATTVSPAAMRIIHVLAGNPPHTIQQLVEATGVTRTAVSEQVKDLMARGLVSRSTRRTQRGRPHHLYTATDHALSTLFSNHQRLMVPALLRAVADVAGQEVAREAMVRASKVLVQHYREQLTAEAPAERLRQFADVLSEEGILAEVSEEGGNCGCGSRLPLCRHGRRRTKHLQQRTIDARRHRGPTPLDRRLSTRRLPELHVRIGDGRATRRIKR